MSSRDRAYIESLYPDVVAEITAEVRERIAADIEFLRLGCRTGETDRLDALDAAARIARGQS